MAKRSVSKLSNIINNDTLVIDDTIPYNNFEQIRVQSQFSAHLIYTGHVSGKRYEWQKAGDVVEVDKEDVEELLSKRLGENSCCGGMVRGNVLFCLAW